jgi:hypothetical protein
MSIGQWESGLGVGATPYPQYYGQTVPTPQPPKKTEWGSYVFGGVFMIVLGIIMLVLFSMAPGASGSGGASMAGYALVFFLIGSVLIAVGMILRNKEILETMHPYTAPNRSNPLNIRSLELTLLRSLRNIDKISNFRGVSGSMPTG